ncbi:MAG: hypothetical protein JJ909_02970 [Roseivirga sp.]|jgi:hypothetical protein|uniref:hypothetical protein n=1 Tax=Roseivirga sp. TaxID=1964215 RepID=UPI001B2C7BFC|nr:hypothetical protein [Roseivirga sp.]MBO6495547.1 hypothetical protein [Roseivirga sp.]MBO6661669.1 hypothetical protein [Roseivirga sp.]MBO6759922.1 hypothetical protein [Roseivirga sp.]MBO6908346.1 hypothetical protein [Roseivirga sp.]
MNKEVLKAIQDVITEWRGRRKFTYENKLISVDKSPIVQSEYLMKFHNSISSFFCEGEKIEIQLSSNFFQTTGLNNDNLGENSTADAHRLKHLLEEFDNAFYEEVDRKIEGCANSLSTSDPIFF